VVRELEPASHLIEDVVEGDVLVIIAVIPDQEVAIPSAPEADVERSDARVHLALERQQLVQDPVADNRRALPRDGAVGPRQRERGEGPVIRQVAHPVLVGISGFNV